MTRAEFNTQKEKSSYTIVSKNEKGEIIVSHPSVKIEHRPNIDMRCTDTVVTVDDKTINLDSPIDSKNITPEFKLCYESVEKLYNQLVRSQSGIYTIEASQGLYIES